MIRFLLYVNINLNIYIQITGKYLLISQDGDIKN